MFTAFERIETVSLADQAEVQIREKILAGDFPPGTPLRDSVLAESMGISRSPVREALRVLEQAGLVEKTLNRSYRTPAIDRSSLPELAALRVADEIVAVRLIVRSGTDITPLGARIADMREASDDEQLSKADAHFHSTMVDLAGLPRLSARYASLSDQISLALRAASGDQGRPLKQFVEPHQDLYDSLELAIESEEPNDVVALWEAHILGGMSTPRLFR